MSQISKWSSYLHDSKYTIYNSLSCWKRQQFCCVVLFFFNWSSGFVFLQLHSRNYMTQKLDTANVLTFGINRLLLISLSQMCVNCFLFHTHGCKIYPVISEVVSYFLRVANCCIFEFNFWKSGSDTGWCPGLDEQILVAQHLKFFFHLPGEMQCKGLSCTFQILCLR